MPKGVIITCVSAIILVLAVSAIEYKAEMELLLEEVKYHHELETRWTHSGTSRIPTVATVCLELSSDGKNFTRYACSQAGGYVRLEVQ